MTEVDHIVQQPNAGDELQGPSGEITKQIEPPVDQDQMIQWILDIRDKDKRETALLELR